MNTSSSKSSPAKTDRKTIEKHRRNQMKCLYSQLSSLVFHDASSSREPLTLIDQVDEATKYIRRLHEKVSDLKRKKDNLLAVDGLSYSSSSAGRRGHSSNSPVQIEVHEKGSAVEVILVTDLECQFVFTEAIRILHEELAEVVNASYSVVGNTVFHSIHAQLGKNASNGVVKITERLKKFSL